MKGLPLTDETLAIYGFSKEDINSLLEENIFKVVEDNKYAFVSMDGMYRYAVYLLLHDQKDKAEKYLRKCYLLEPTNRKICMQLVLLELCRKNYIAAKKMFSVLREIEPEQYKEDNNIYLYLFGIILYDNKEFNEITKNMLYEDVFITSDKYREYRVIENKIRSLILNQKYPFALEMLNNLRRETFVYNVEYELLKELIINAINLNKTFKFNLKRAVNSKNYNRIINMLEEKDNKQNINSMELNMLLVARSILDIINNNELPIVDTSETDDLFEAIIQNNFKLARDINIKFLEKVNGNKENDLLNILLEDIINKIDSFKVIESNKDEVEVITSIKNRKEKLSEEEELAYYIKEMNYTLDGFSKSVGLLPEQVCVIKLIYARDCFIDLDMDNGNKLLSEAEDMNIYSDKIIELYDEIRDILLNSKTEGYKLIRIKDERDINE